MNRDYYGYDTSQLPCRNREHSTFKDTTDTDHFTDFWWNVEETSQYCVFQPCPHRNNQLGYHNPTDHWYSPNPEEANRVLDAHPDGVHLTRTLGPPDDPQLEGLRERIRQWKLFNEPRVPGGFGDEEDETTRLPRAPGQSDQEDEADVQDLLEDQTGLPTTAPSPTRSSSPILPNQPTPGTINSPTHSPHNQPSTNPISNPQPSNSSSRGHTMAPTASDISRSFQNLDKLDPSGRNYRTWSQRIKDAMIMLDQEAAITTNSTNADKAKVENSALTPAPALEEQPTAEYTEGAPMQHATS